MTSHKGRLCYTRIRTCAKCIHHPDKLGRWGEKTLWAHHSRPRISVNHPRQAVQLAKEAVNQSFNSSLNEGLMFERKNFYLAFASEDQKEGMKAFVEKRKPDFKGR